MKLSLIGDPEVFLKKLFPGLKDYKIRKENLFSTVSFSWKKEEFNFIVMNGEINRLGNQASTNLLIQKQLEIDAAEKQKNGFPLAKIS
jgi:hypothetical protein